MKWSAAMFMPRINAIRQISGTEQTYCRWKKKYGATGTKQLKELKRLQTKNQCLRRAVSDLSLDKLILSEAAREYFEPLTPSIARQAITKQSAERGLH